MKLNLVADYVVPGTGGKRFVASFAIDASNNLMGLPGLVSLSFPVRGSGCIVVRPISLTMCESRRKAEMVEDDNRDLYKLDGRWWDYSPIDPYLAAKEQEGEVA